MGKLSIGEVVFVPFPYSDLSGAKLRPAVVLASAERDDWLLCQVTSRSYTDTGAVILRPADFASGSLMAESYARPAKLFTAHESLVRRQVGQLEPETLSRIVERTVAVLRGTH